VPEDVVQEALLRACGMLERLGWPSAEHFAAWLGCIAVHVLWNVSRKRASGRLVKLCDHAVADWNYYLVLPEGLRQRQPVAAFREWLLRDTEPLRQVA